MINEHPPAESPGQPQLEAHWLALARAGNAVELCAAWLPLICGMVPGARAGLLLLEDVDGSYAPLAAWPAGRDLGHLAGIAQESLAKRQGTVHRQADGGVRLAYPLTAGDKPFGTVVLELQPRGDAALTAAMRQLHWGAGWLMDLHNRRALQERDGRLERSTYLFDLLLALLSEADDQKANLAMVNLLAQRFGCHQVAYGIEKGKTVRVVAMSHAAWFDERSNLVNLAAQAMNEAFDQRVRLALPEAEAGPPQVTAALRRYAEESASSSLCAVPVESPGGVVGVWLLERDGPFTVGELEELDTLALAVGPALGLRQSAGESVVRHLVRAWRWQLGRLTDTSRPGLKLAAAVVLLAAVVTAFYPADFRVTAQAAVEGEIQRVVSAPFNGYIREASARAGDLVQAGQLLAVLEDKDLRLEQVRWEAELEVAVRKQREAMANRDRVALRLATAQANQARAQLDLALEKLNRVKVAAPIDGVIVSGDLSQQLGSPVQQGDVLFELAPLDAWRVILQVDERDVAYLQQGQSGSLVLASLPGQAFPLAVNKVTPVAVAEDGRNYFRVEAGVKEGASSMRPGMEGLGKVEIGERSLLWIWTRRFTEWLRLKAWEWLP